MEQSNKRIICFGDSNTYGFDPVDPFGGRYPPSERWPDILAERTGWQILNMGLNGRTIPRAGWETDLALTMLQNSFPVDLVIIMLGSNDAFLMSEPSAEKVSARMDVFLSYLTAAFPKLSVFLISPPHVEIPHEHFLTLFLDLIPAYHKLAEKYNMLFAAAPSWDLPLASDGIHLSPEAHKEFAFQVETRLRQL